MFSSSRVLVVVAALCAFGAACSSDNGPAPQPGPEPIGVGTEPLTGKCQTQTFQLPCDPDDTGPLTECQGICTQDPSGKMQCVPITAVGLADVDGKLFGDAPTRSSVCTGTACVAPHAPHPPPRPPTAKPNTRAAPS